DLIDGGDGSDVCSGGRAPDTIVNCETVSGVGSASSGSADTAMPPWTPLAPRGGTIGYEVQPGDTLIDIAARFGTTVEALVQLNGLEDPNVILYGSTLNVPYVGEDAGGAPAGMSP
ncbi:unnamed protein product, partial [marine sediment metagenome]